MLYAGAAGRGGLGIDRRVVGDEVLQPREPTFQILHTYPSSRFALVYISL